MTGTIPARSVRELETTAGRFATLRYGGPTRPVESTVLVGTVPTRILKNNPRRVAWRMWNRSGNSIDLGLDGTVTAGAGVPLTAATGFAESDVEIEGEEVLHEVFGVSSAASSAVRVMEVERV